MEMTFRDPDHITTVEQKLEALKQTNYKFSSYYVRLLYNTADVQGNDPAKCTTLMQVLNNEIKDALALSDNILQQFQRFIAFLYQLNNQI
jgi:hypothetical protein